MPSLVVSLANLHRLGELDLHNLIITINSSSDEVIQFCTAASLPFTKYKSGHLPLTITENTAINTIM
jgi:hypothetical protein